MRLFFMPCLKSNKQMSLLDCLVLNPILLIQYLRIFLVSQNVFENENYVLVSEEFC